MEEQLITFETAKLAKEKGFNEKCFKHFDFNRNLSRISRSIDVVIGPYEEALLTDEFHYLAPTQSLLQKWLRDVHNIHVNSIIAIWTHNKFRYNICYKKDNNVQDILPKDIWYETYEQALEIGLQEALKLIEEK